MKNRKTTEWVFITMTALILVASGCAKKAPEARLTLLKDDAVILIYASGLAEEGDLFRPTMIDEIVASVMKRSIVNKGVGAEFSEKALERLPRVLDESKPQLMVLGYGAMDLWKKTDRDKLKKNLCSMIDLARKQQSEVVLLAMPDLHRLRMKPDPIFEEVAKEKNVPIEPTLISSVLSDYSLRTFRYLPNDDGIQKMAEGLRDFCVQRGALTK